MRVVRHRSKALAHSDEYNDGLDYSGNQAPTRVVAL